MLAQLLQSWWPRGRHLIGVAAVFAALVLLNFIVNALTGFNVLRFGYYWLARPADASADSWRVMIAALNWVQTGPDGTLYEEIFFRQRMKFQYPPTSLLPLSALQALGAELTPQLLNSINRVAFGLTAVAMGALAWLLARHANWDRDMRLAASVLAAASVFLLYPLIYAFHIGQIQVWLSLFFVCACICWVLDRRALAGLFIGLICLIKPQLALFGVWALWRREWRFAAALAATGAVGGLVSIWLYGIANHFAYLEPLSFMARHGETYAPNQSFNGLLNRMFGAEDLFAFDMGSFPPYRPIVYIGTLITTLAILFFALWGRTREDNARPLADFMLAGLAFTIASPIAWEFHYGVLAPIFVALFFIAATMSDQRRRRCWLAATAVLFATAALGHAVYSLRIPSPFHLVQSYLLYAGLAVLTMLWLVNRSTQRAS
ncbi:MAG: DUF2029 domain-containing protein [Hyphomonadaceae bacterium]|nr:DUF2029 domain-containing protein [Hyphomonadaceae bacterium]